MDCGCEDTTTAACKFTIIVPHKAQTATEMLRCISGAICLSEIGSPQKNWWFW